MSRQSLLYLRNDSLAIYQWDKHTLVEVLHLESSEYAKQPLVDFFADHPHSIRIYIDILEESYALESLPHLGYSDRMAMIERKKKQLFPQLNYIFSEYKGRGNSERRDDIILFSAISEEQIIKQWLQLLFELKVNISGIFSLPVLIEPFAQQLQGKQNKLLISFFSNQQGMFIRQSFFNEGILALSRFKQIESSDHNKLADEIREDVNRTQRFIDRQYNLANQNNLSTYFFGSGTLAQALYEQIDFPSITLNPHFVLTSDFAQSQGHLIDKNCGLSAYIAALNTKKRLIKTHYKDTLGQFYFRHFLLKQRLNLASLLIALSGFFYIGSGLFDQNQMVNQVTDLQTQKNQLTNSLQTSPEAPLFKDFSPFELVKQLQTQKNISQQKISPISIMSAISQSLQAFPTIKLSKLEWGNQSIQKQQFPDPLAFDPSAQPNTNNAEPPVQMVLEAKIEPFNGNYRYALALIQRFSDHLNSHNHINEVSANKLPVNISSDKILSGAIQKENDTLHNIFILEMQWQR